MESEQIFKVDFPIDRPELTGASRRQWTHHLHQQGMYSQFTVQHVCTVLDLDPGSIDQAQLTLAPTCWYGSKKGLNYSQVTWLCEGVRILKHVPPGYVLLSTLTVIPTNPLVTRRQARLYRYLKAVALSWGPTSITVWVPPLNRWQRLKYKLHRKKDAHYEEESSGSDSDPDSAV
jgi:hypothetical protein